MTVVADTDVDDVLPTYKMREKLLPILFEMKLPVELVVADNSDVLLVTTTLPPFVGDNDIDDVIIST